MMDTSTVAEKIIEYFEKEAIPRYYNHQLKAYDLKNMLDELKDDAYQAGYEKGYDDGLEA